MIVSFGCLDRGGVHAITCREARRPDHSASLGSVVAAGALLPGARGKLPSKYAPTKHKGSQVWLAAREADEQELSRRAQAVLSWLQQRQPQDLLLFCGGEAAAAGGSGGRAASAAAKAAVSHLCACIGSPCLRQCVHGAPIGGGGGGAPAARVGVAAGAAGGGVGAGPHPIRRRGVLSGGSGVVARRRWRRGWRRPPVLVHCRGEAVFPLQALLQGDLLASAVHA
jgi:hypothetical protein